VTEIAREAAEDGLDALFVIGGDGTIRRAASGLVGSRTALGILPAGTMNVFAKELSLWHFTWYRPWGLASSVSKLATARLSQVDVGRFGSQYFLLWVGIGLDAITVQQLEPRPRLDKFVTVPHYAAQVVWNATQWHGQELQFRVGGQEISGQYILVVVANVRKYVGGLVTISPQARLDDGEMDLWLFSGSALMDTARHAANIVTQRHTHSLDVQRLPFRSLEIESGHTFGLQVDGDPEPGFQKLELEVLPRALRLLVPNGSPVSHQLVQPGQPLPDLSGSIAGLTPT
jgi:diacylglycerol kinase family enzyme